MQVYKGRGQQTWVGARCGLGKVGRPWAGQGEPSTYLNRPGRQTQEGPRRPRPGPYSRGGAGSTCRPSANICSLLEVRAAAFSAHWLYGQHKHSAKLQIPMICHRYLVVRAIGESCEHPVFGARRRRPYGMSNLFGRM